MHRVARATRGTWSKGLVVAGACGVAFNLPLRAQAGESSALARASYVGVDYEYAHFAGNIEPWQIASASVGVHVPRGLVIGRVNHARRFARTGAQVEIDAYPRLTKKIYAYVNAGFSGADVFPQWRSGGELYASLPRAWEASAGYRQLRFGGAPVTVFTGSVGKYANNSWISLRPYIRSTAGSVSASLGLTMRRYTVDAENYVGVRGSFGSSPTDRNDPSELARTQSWLFGLTGSKTLRPRLVLKWSAGRESEDLRTGSTRRRWDGSLGLRAAL